MVHAQNSVMVVHCLVANDKSIISSRTDSLPSPFSVTDGKNQQKTRKHSSRSLTACLLTVGGVQGCVCPRGVSRGCAHPPSPRQTPPPGPRGRHLADPDADCGQTDIYENITVLQTSFASCNNRSGTTSQFRNELSQWQGYKN